MSAKKLFIVESPNKCGKIRKILGSEYKVMASVGHIREIPKKGMNIDIENGFEPKYEISKDKKKVVKELREEANKVDVIVLATDPDREGEAIAHALYEALGVANQSKCVRVRFDSVTDAAIKKAVSNSGDIDDCLVNASKARQVLDRLIGYRVSPLVWKRTGDWKTSAGRVQSVALKLVCARQKEIDAFKPVDFWHIDALLKGKDGEFWARVVTKDKDNRYYDEDVSKKDYEALKKADFTADKIERKEKSVKASAPFDTADLQSTASSLFKWSVKKVQTMAQKLYEEGRITYIRTDSYHVSDEAMKEVRGLIKKASCDDYLPSKPNVYKQKSGAAAQEAHECIRPTHVYEKGDDIADAGQKKLYKLIRDRFIASQMTPMVVDTVSYHVKASSKHTLIAKGQTIKFDGWHKVYKYSKTKEEILPPLEKGECLDLKDSKHSKHSTQPPPRYTGAKLVKLMKDNGVGRPSTWASIVSSLSDKGYVNVGGEGVGKTALVATDLGMKISDYLDPNFNDFFMDVTYTATLEEDLNLIADGQKTFLEVVEAVYKVLQEHVGTAKENMPEREAPKSTGEKCVVCKEGEIVIRNGRYGEFFACNKYPGCKTVYEPDEEKEGKYKVKEKKKFKDMGEKCHRCKKGNIIERPGKFGNFFACDRYPACKTSYIQDDEGNFQIKTRRSNGD